MGREIKIPEKDCSNESKEFQQAEIDKNDGLNISYDKEELKEYLPHLMEEITIKEKSVKIEDVTYDIENTSKTEKEDMNKESLSDNLSNPGAIDFIRRCSTKKEAFEILEYLLKRKEIREDEYRSLKRKINKRGGLSKLIESYGGLKKPGYYIDKYYHKFYLDKSTNDK